MRYYNNLEKLPSSVLISIDLPILILPTFRALNYYSIMGSMNYFGQVVLEIVENNLLESYFRNLEMSAFLEIYERRKSTFYNHAFVFLKKL